MAYPGLLIYGLKFCALLLVLSNQGCTCSSRQNPLATKPVVKVDDLTMNAQQFADQLVMHLKDLDALSVKDEANIRQAKEQVIRDFIIDAMSELWAKENGLIVRREDLDEEIDRIRKSYPDDLSFRRSLADEDLTFEEWRRLMRSRVLQKKISEMIRQDLPEPSESELESFYRSHTERFQRPQQARLRQIVLASESDAQAVIDELNRGGDFSDLAEKFSISPEANQGGELGWIERGTLEVFDHAFSLNPRQRTAILQSPYGFHIIEVMEKRGLSTISFNEAQPEILRSILENREQAAYSSWLEDQVRQRKVFRDNDFINALIIETRSQ